MKFDNFVRYAMTAKSFTQKSVKGVAQMPFDKIVIGTAAIALPGGMVITGVYYAAQELKQRYELHVDNAKEINAKPDSFRSWLNDNYVGYIKEKKNNAAYSINDSLRACRMKVTKITTLTVNSIKSNKK